MEPLWVDDAAKLAELDRGRSRDEPRYALDTEFHGERSYWPRLALDPDRVARRASRSSTRSRVDLAPLGEVLGGAGLHGRPRGRAGPRDPRARVRRGAVAAVRHAGRGRASSGLGTPSLAATVERLLGVRLTKGDRLTDWTRRPLRAEQRVYAAADVEYLLALHDVLVARLEPMGRLELGDSTSARNAGCACAPVRNRRSRGGA